VTRNIIDPYDIAGQADAAEDAQALAAIARRKELLDLAAVLDTPGGRRFAHRLLGETGLFKTSMTGNSHTFFNEGKRQIGLWLLAEITENFPQHLSAVMLAGGAADAVDVPQNAAP
jgi:hypothetical protein